VRRALLQAAVLSLGASIQTMCAALTSAHGATLQRTLTIAAGAEGRVMAAGHAKAGRAKLNALCLRLLQGHHVRDAASIEVQEGAVVP